MLNVLTLMILFNTSSWMMDNRDIIYKKNLRELTIPGTHDSGSYNLTKKYIDIPKIYSDLISLGKYFNLPVDDIIINWTKTQNVDIISQLNKGSRHLDIRLFYYENDWYIHHNFILGQPIIDILEQVERFLLLNQGEIVIFEITHIENVTTDNLRELNNTIYSKLGIFLYKSVTYNNDTIGSLVGKGQRLLVISSVDIFMYKYTIQNYWANTDNEKKLVSFSNTLMKKWNSTKFNQLIKLDWVLTPNIETIILNVLNNGSLPILEKNLNNLIDQWMYSYIKSIDIKCPVFPNIISIDYIEKGNVTKHIIDSLIKCYDK